MGESVSTHLVVFTCSHVFRLPLSLPRNVEQLQALANQLSGLKEQHFYSVLLVFVCLYLWKQTFSIPGSAILVGI